jgi:hypothetical protein
MSDEAKKVDLKVVDELDYEADVKIGDEAEKVDLKSADESGEDEAKKVDLKLVEELDKDEAEFCALRRDVPSAKGASAVGIVSIGVSKIPGKNEFFRTHPEFRPIIPIVDLEVGMEKQFFAVSDAMVTALAGIGITVSDHTLYLTVTENNATRIVPVRCAGADGAMNEYARTKEIGLRRGVDEWVRLYTDQDNKVYKVYPARKNLYADPIWPELKAAKIFRLAFRDKGRLIDSVEHPLFQKWAARGRSNDR